MNIEGLESRRLLAGLVLELSPEELAVRKGIFVPPDLSTLLQFDPFPEQPDPETLYSDWSNTVACTTWVGESPPRQGDANMDGQVDGSDYAVLDANAGSTEPLAWAHGDVNLDGKVDGSDYAILDANVDR